MAPGTSVMFVYNDASNDSRVWREAGALTQAGWDVTIIGLQTGHLPSRESHAEGQLIRVGGAIGALPGDRSAVREGGSLLDRARWIANYGRALANWRALAAAAAAELGSRAPRVYHAHDLTGLLAARLARRYVDGMILYDSHELFVEAGSAARLPPPARWLLKAYEDKSGRESDAVITVNASIASELAARFGRRPAIVMNAPEPFGDLPTRSRSPLRSVLKLGDRPVVIHHGGLARGRGIERTIEAVAGLAPAVALVLLGNGELVPEIQAAAGGGMRERLYHHPAVPIGELPEWLAGADVGVIAFEAVDRNNFYGTPNKLFEYLACGVGVVVSDFPEMRTIVEEQRVGLTCDPEQVASIRAAIHELLTQSPTERAARAERARSLTNGVYSWNTQRERLLSAYEVAVTARRSPG